MSYFELCNLHLQNVLKIVNYVKENFDNDLALAEFFKKMLYNNLATSANPESGTILKGMRYDLIYFFLTSINT
jgi:hypothetical protein